MAHDEARTSFERCEAAGDFAERFYEIFLNSSPEIAPLFAQTDFEKQRKLLGATVYITVTRDVDDPKAREALEEDWPVARALAARHQAELYELWLDGVCETAKRMDPVWTSEVEAAWRHQPRPGIALITSLY